MTIRAYENCKIRQLIGSLEKVWEIFKTDFSNMLFNDMINFHSTIITIEMDLDLYKMMVCFSRGKLYYTLKKFDTSNFEKNIENYFHFSKRQANKYVQFYLAIITFPRLLVCGKSFTEIVQRLKYLKRYEENNSEFDAILRGPVLKMKFNEIEYDINSAIINPSVDELLQEYENLDFDD